MIENKNTKVLLETTLGNITLELDDARAPKTVANFLSYVKDGFYHGTIFHRTIPSFMIQGGGFKTKVEDNVTRMVQKPARGPIENEANNGLRNKRYTIAMARTSDPHSASSQFFINTVDNDFLDFTAPTPNGWGYAVFGKVVEGQAVVDAISAIRTTTKGFHQNVPVEDVTIIRAVVIDDAQAPQTEAA